MPSKIFRAGSLSYSLAGLCVIFFWLLWGDFCFVLTNHVWKSILPLQIKAMHMPDWIIGTIFVSLPSTLNVVLNPFISTSSDRHRSRWGRRRPFMLVATPLIAVFLALLGVSPDIGRWLHGTGLGELSGWSLGAITVSVIAVVVFLFYTADLFVGTLFYYLLNDVVPAEVMARFLALFRVAGSAATAFYNYFIFPHALEHTQMIFLCVALLYLVSFMMMCFFVKEGEYPPPEPLVGKSRNLMALGVAYFKECTHKKVYILLYIHVMIWTLANVCGVFFIFLNLSLGLGLKEIGTIAAASSVVTTLLTYPAGMFADRFHPLRLMIWIEVAIVAVTPLGLIWLFVDFSPTVNFYIVFAISIINLPLNVLYAATLMPLYMRLFPREKFGQFCSFNAICGALVSAFGGFIGGYFLDVMRRGWPDAIYGKNYAYRFIPAWDLFFSGLALLFLALLYWEWRKTVHEPTSDKPDTNGDKVR